MSGMATVAGPAWSNAGPPDRRGMRGEVRFRPVQLDEREAPVDSRSIVRAVLTEAGELVRAARPLPVMLWPGVWEVTMPDGEKFNPAMLEADRSYTLAELRGSVPPPGTGVITLPSGAVSSVAGRTGDVVLSSADLTDVASLATDAELASGLAGKANSSHTHTAEGITDWAEAVQDTVAAMLVSGANVTLTYDDTAGKVTVTAVGGDAEVMRDTIGAALVGVGGVSVAVNDAADTITLSISGVTSTQIADSTATGRSVLTAADAAAARTAIGAGTSNIDTEAVQGIVGAMVTGAGGTYDDAAGTITLPAGGGGGGGVETVGRNAWGLPIGTPMGQCTISMIAGRRYGQYFITPAPIRVMGLETATAGATGANLRIGVYGPAPGSSALIDSGLIGLSTAGQKSVTLTTPVVLPAGIYFLQGISDASVSVNTLFWAGSGGSVPSYALVSNAYRPNTHFMSPFTADITTSMPTLGIGSGSGASAQAGGLWYPALLRWEWV